MAAVAANITGEIHPSQLKEAKDMWREDETVTCNEVHAMYVLPPDYSTGN
jgi:hypothetical protein